MTRTFLGVVHLAPLPSSSRGGSAFEPVLERAVADARALATGGVDGIVVENFGDAPFHKGTQGCSVPPDVPAALAVVAREVRLATGLPVAINCLRNDGQAALGAAAIAGARWIRVNVLIGAYVTDQGVIEGEAARLAAYRRQLGADTEILADLFVKHAEPLVATPIAVAAKDLAERSGAAGLILSGRRTGESVDAALLRQVRAAVPGFPIWIGSGLTVANAAELAPLCDGAIVGTALKRDAVVTAEVEVARVAALVSAFRS